MDLSTGKESATTPNAPFIDCWRTVVAPKFEAFREIFIEGAAAHSDPVIEGFGEMTGKRVLDVGCGWGDTTLQLARQVGATGRVVGQDCVASFMDQGRTLAAAEHLVQLQFSVGDAEVQRFDTPFDLVFSRFGTMFFGSPVAALRNLGSQLEAGGLLSMITWRSIEDNEWLRIAKQVARRHLPPPPEDGQTCGPGPFSMSNRDVVEAQLRAAGFDNVRFVQSDALMPMGKTVGEAITQMMSIGPAGEIVREAGSLGERLRPVIEDELAAAIAPFWRPDKGVRMSSSAWVVHARRA